MSRGRNVLVAAIAAGLAGCAELPPLEEAACGNGVIEPGEDCDGVTAFPEQTTTACGAPDDTHACRQIWGGDVVCPSGWGAAADGTCGHGNGLFTPVSVVPAGFAFVAVGDSDGDGFPDLVGQSFSNTIEAWSGDDQGVFGGQKVLSVGQITGSSAFGYLDDLDPTTALLDAVVPQALGIFAIRSMPGAGLEPVIFPTFAIDFNSRAIPKALITTANLVELVSHGVLLYERADGSVNLSTLEGSDVSASELRIPTLKGLDDLVGSPVTVSLDGPAPRRCSAGSYYDEPTDTCVATAICDADAECSGLGLECNEERATCEPDPRPEPAAEPPAGRDELLVAFAGEARVHAIRFVQDPATLGGDPRFVPEALPALELPDGMRVAAARDGDEIDLLNVDDAEVSGIRVGDLNGDEELDVIVRATDVGPSRQIRVVTFLGNGDGTFQAPFQDTRFEGLRASSVSGCPFAGRELSPASRWPLAIGDLNGDGAAEAIGEHGIYVSLPNLGFCPISPDFVSWLEATIGDFNADGFPDLAAVPSFSRAIDFRISAGNLLFNRFQASTEGLPSRLRVGDFDGDFVNDLALVEIDPAATDMDAPPRGELSILYGDPAGAPSVRVSMGPVSDVTALTTGSSPFDFLGLDATTDIFLQSGLGEGATASIMVGSSQRRMLAPLALTTAGPEVARVPTVLQLGRFRNAAGVPDSAPDVFALAERRPVGAMEGGLEAWFVPGQEEGSVVSTELALGHPYAASLAELSTFTSFRVECAEYVSGDLGPRTPGEAEIVDEIVAVDATCDEAAVDAGLEPHLQVLYVAAESGGVSLQNFPVEIGASLRVPRRPRLADLDGDGDVDIVVPFAGSADDTGRALAIYFNNGTVGPGQFSETLVQLGESSVVPLDSAIVNLDDDPQREIAVLLPGRIVFFDVDGAAVTPIEGGLDLRDLSFRLATGDVNRDGIDDLLASGVVQTTVLLQGAASDLLGSVVVGGAQ